MHFPKSIYIQPHLKRSGMCTFTLLNLKIIMDMGKDGWLSSHVKCKILQIELEEN